MMSQKNLLELPSAVHLLRNQHLAVHLKRESPEVEKFVVQRAQSNTVLYGIGAIGLVPLDMRRLQSDRHVANPQIQTTQGTSILIGHQNRIAKIRIPPPTRNFRALSRKSNGIQ